MVYRWMAGYFVVLLGATWSLGHGGGHGWLVYFWSVLPALPILGVFWQMSLYLREETDEYQRWQVTQSLLVGAGCLLGSVMVNDFLRAFAHVAGLPPFVSFLIFFAGVALTQMVQRLTNRTSDE